jgi:hypothetical protein
MKQPLLFIFILSLCTALYSQEPHIGLVFEPQLCGEVYTIPKGFSGNQYFNKEWLVGDIVLNSGDTASNKLLKYNGFLDELIWLDSANNRQVKLEKHFIGEFSLKMPGDRVFKFKRIQERQLITGDPADIFVEVLSENAASLYVQRIIATRGVTTKYIEGKDYSLDYLEPQPKYFLVLPDGQTAVFRWINKRAFLRILPGSYVKTVKSILRERNLPLRNEKQLAEIVKRLH